MEVSTKDQDLNESASELFAEFGKFDDENENPSISTGGNEGSTTHNHNKTSTLKLELELEEPLVLVFEEKESNGPAGSTAEEQINLKSEQLDPEFLFQLNEKILCFHGHLLYEGKIVQTKVKDNQAFYLVHYLGWNKKWNEWMNDERILKYNEENLEREKDLKLASDASMKTTKKGHANNKATSSLSKQKLDGESNGKPNSRSSTPLLDLDGNKIPGSSEGKALQMAAKMKNTTINVESEMFYNKKQEVFIPIPDDLKMRLAEDWERINCKNQLVIMPSKPNLAGIKAEYLEFKENAKDATELLEGFVEIFDQMLSDQFLYPSEKQQLLDVIKLEENKDKYFSDLYGGHHLLRVISKLGQFLAFSVLEKEEIDELTNQLKDFFGFLVMKEEEYFGGEHYYDPSPEYIKKVAGKSR